MTDAMLRRQIFRWRIERNSGRAFLFGWVYYKRTKFIGPTLYVHLGLWIVCKAWP